MSGSMQPLTELRSIRSPFTSSFLKSEKTLLARETGEHLRHEAREVSELFESEGDLGGLKTVVELSSEN